MSLPRDSPNTPGSTRETSSRESIRLRYCSAISTDQGETKSDSSAITATSGAANISTGRSQAASDSPELNQITISESRQAAVQRQQHGDEERQRQQDRQQVERGKAEERDHRVRRELASRGLAEQADQARGERNQEQRKKDGDG